MDCAFAARRELVVKTLFTQFRIDVTLDNPVLAGKGRRELCIGEPVPGLAVVHRSSGTTQWGRDGRPFRNNKKVTTLGLNRNHNAALKEVFKSAAVIAICFDQQFKKLYQSYVERGLKEPVARVHVARKLATIALTIWKKGRGIRPSVSEGHKRIARLCDAHDGPEGDCQAARWRRNVRRVRLVPMLSLEYVTGRLSGSQSSLAALRRTDEALACEAPIEAYSKTESDRELQSAAVVPDTHSFQRQEFGLGWCNGGTGCKNGQMRWAAADAEVRPLDNLLYRSMLGMGAFAVSFSGLRGRCV